MRLDEDLGIEPLFEECDGIVRLNGSRCRTCGVTAFPPRVVCLECGGAHERALLSGRGVLHSSTTVENPPSGFDCAYGYGCVDLDEGPRLLAPLGGRPLEVGQAVQAVPARVRDSLAGFRFEARDA
jgi:uncharacterized OB-fold protein